MREIKFRACPKKEAMRDIATMDRFPVFWLAGEIFGYEGEDLVSNKVCGVIGNIHDNPELMQPGEKRW